MGRPLPKLRIGAVAASGSQYRLYGILDIGVGSEALHITKQINTKKFKVSNAAASRTGYVILQQATPSAVGQARLEVAPYGASTATATATMKAVGAAITTGGTGYTVNDVLTVVGGTRTVAATITVNTVSSGVITAVTVTAAGNYTVLPADSVAVTGGTGTGATFNVDWGVNTIVVTDGGTGYEDAPVVTITGGTGATATSALTATAVSGVTVTAAGTGFVSTAVVSIAGSKEYAKSIGRNVVKTFEGNIYKYVLGVSAAATGEATVDAA